MEDTAEKTESTTETNLQLATKNLLLRKRAELETSWESTRIASLKTSPEFQQDRLGAILKNYWEGSSASHAIQCAVHRVAHSRFMIGILTEIANSGQGSEERRQLAAEAADELKFQNKLNSLLADLMVTDLLTYQEVHDPNYPEWQKLEILDINRNLTRDTFSIVSGELEKVKSLLVEIEPQLREKVHTLAQAKNLPKRAFEDFNRLGVNEIGQLFDQAIVANNNGEIARLDESIKSLIGHFANGAFILEEVLSDRWLRKVESMPTTQNGSG